MKTIGERLRFLRVSNKLTVQQLADSIGKTKGNVSSYENDKYEPSAQTIISICKRFDVSADWLLTGEDKFQNQNIGPDSSNIIDEDILPLNEMEIDMIKKFRKLDSRDQEDAKDNIDRKFERGFKKGTFCTSRTSGEEAATKEVV
ncbi:helix-turn-helix domain-containing protein [Clostridium amazonitimonense]|uniref:helix-turn-helix domain-containing protein n=1 Tax=Clostridium amazonitimonense TaxID=1499689 RepID=UPI0006909E17|nr:helix-turn-helix transcriptional regulator [Clostridium amazonitimonense]